MPNDAAGNYIPLTPGERRIIAERAFNLINNNPALSTQEVAQGIAQSVHIDQFDGPIIYPAIARARREVDAGHAMDITPTIPPPLTIIPVIPGDPEDRGITITDVIITIIDPATGERSTDRIEYRSDEPLSADEIREDILSHPGDYWTIRSPAPPPGITPETGDIDVLIIGVRIGA